MEEAVNLISRLVRFRTTADNPGEIRKCADFIVDYLKHDGIVVKVHERKSKISIVAAFVETKKPQIFFNAHFDVVPASSGLFEPKVRGGKIYGRGSEDCKAQVAVLMLLMRHFAVQSKKPDVGIVLTSDEEVGGADGVGFLLSVLGYSSEFAVVADGGDDFDVVTKHKGILQVKVSALGKSAHSARAWEGGDNAIEKLIGAYGRIRKLFPALEKPEWKTSLSLNKIAGGDVINKVPDYAELYLDIRRTEKDSEEEILRKLGGVGGVRVEKVASAGMLITDEGNSYVRKLVASAERVLKRRIRTYHEHGATDARFFSAKGIPAAVFKPIGFGAHSDNEHVVISSLEPYFKVLVDFVNSATKKK